METWPSFPVIRYTPAAPAGAPVKLLLSAGGTAGQLRYAFFDHLEIGRDEEGRVAQPGLLLLRDPSVSYRHCVLTQDPSGRCFVRDLSRNGTRVQGRRLVPNVEVEIMVGQVLEVTSRHQFLLTADGATDPAPAPVPQRRTQSAPHMTLATVLVGDIRDYTVLVRKAPSTELQQSISRVFERLTAGVASLGGTVKEFQGDAILAFWEGKSAAEPAISACHAAIELDRMARHLAADRSVWTLPDLPLQMDWALSTGVVVIDSFGTGSRLGLSMVGEPVVMAFRLEKLASGSTGRVLTCRMTQEMASKVFAFTDLGEMQAKGFDYADHVFALNVGDP